MEKGDEESLFGEILIIYQFALDRIHQLAMLGKQTS